LLFDSAWLRGAEDRQAVTIMTQNVDAGSDLSYILGLFGTQPQLGVDLTLAEIQASKIPLRADLLATQIALRKPDILALQEVTLWRVGPTPDTATSVLYDQLELLRSALSAHGVPYQIVTVDYLTDIALPGSVGALRVTDRNAVLVRSGPCPPEFHISDVQTHLYDAAFDFAGLQVRAGWISADLHVRNRHLRFVTTHLESAIPGIPEATAIQVAQANELIDSLRNTTAPIVLAGDFNSDANFGSGPDATPSVFLLEAAGYADTWKMAHPSHPGPTWPLFLEDQTPPNFFARAVPFERIDLFFSEGIQAERIERVLAPVPSGLPSYGSDHAGVLATFHL